MKRVDTIREALNIFVMSALCYPNAFLKAREEVDRVYVTGGSPLRLPGVDDMEKMPSISAMIKELL